MRQTPAAILVLASALLAQTAIDRGADPIGGLMGLGGLALGLWGVLSLVVHCARQPGLPVPQFAEPGGIGTTLTADSRLERATAVIAARPGSKVHAASRLPDAGLSPEVNAQLSLVAHLQGQDRTQIMEELLRRHLPRYTNSRR